MNVVDSSAWLAFFAGEVNANYFAGVIAETESLLIPAICIYEVFRVLLQKKNENDGFKAMAAMRQGTVVDLNQDLALKAAVMSQSLKLSMADAIIYATAQFHNATLWTQDKHFDGLSQVNYRAKSDKPITNGSSSY